MTKKFYGAFALTILALLGAAGCKKSTNGAASGNLGTVDGDPITQDQFYRYLERKPTVLVTNQGREVKVQVAETLGFQAMQDLVQQKLLLEVAKDEGVLPTPEDIDKELALRKRQNSNYIDSLLKAGLTTEDIRNEIKLALAREKIATKGVIVSENEAKQFIAAHKASFSTPPQAKLLLIVVNTAQKKAAADNDLKSGQNFASVAMVYSTAPNARQNGGAFPVTNLSQMPPALQKLVQETPENKSTDWKKDGSNWVKFYVQSKSPSKPLPVNADLILMVQREMAQKKSPTNDIDFQKRMMEKIKTAKVDFSQSFYKDGWKQYADTLAAATAQAGH